MSIKSRHGHVLSKEHSNKHINIGRKHLIGDYVNLYILKKKKFVAAVHTQLRAEKGSH